MSLQIPDVRSYVVGEAAAAVDESGRFRRSSPVAPDGGAVVDPEHAVAIAEAYLRDFIVGGQTLPLPGAVSFRETIQVQRWCHRIVWSDVRVAGESWFVGITPFIVDRGALPGFVYRYYGPKYHVPVVERGVWIGTISLAAYATGLSLDESGHIRWPADENGGNTFSVVGVRCEFDSGLPPAPEEAVRYAAVETGHSVRKVPELIQPGGRFVPAFARWKVTLDAPVRLRVRSSGDVVESDVVYVGVYPSNPGGATEPGMHLEIPVDDQPAGELTSWRDADGVRQEAFIPRSPDIPGRFLEVVVAK